MPVATFVNVNGAPICDKEPIVDETRGFSTAILASGGMFVSAAALVGDKLRASMTEGEAVDGPKADEADSSMTDGKAVDGPKADDADSSMTEGEAVDGPKADGADSSSDSTSDSSEDSDSEDALEADVAQESHDQDDIDGSVIELLPAAEKKIDNSEDAIASLHQASVQEQKWNAIVNGLMEPSSALRFVCGQWIPWPDRNPMSPYNFEHKERYEQREMYRRVYDMLEARDKALGETLAERDILQAKLQAVEKRLSSES